VTAARAAAEHGTQAGIAAELERVRARTLALLAPLSDDVLCRQPSPIVSPLVWDLAHIGHFEELWLVRALGAGGALAARTDDVYDASRHARSERTRLELFTPAEARSYLEQVRERTLATLSSARLEGDDPLLRDAFVYGLVLQHELQHQETMLLTLQLLGPVGYPLPDLGAATTGRQPWGEVRIDGGAAVVGTDDDPWAYDNERPSHEIELAPFWIDAVPVTNGAYAAFVAAGGYEDERLWTADGWRWRCESAVAMPGSWRREGGDAFSRERFGVREPVPEAEPVQHVCAHEADAFARWAGRRLPSEQEWETAARSDGRWPWGDAPPTPERANLGWQRLSPAAAGSLPAGASAAGVHQLVGDVWEWTSSTFGGWPGFEAFPYREYSEDFFGEGYRVLRGGSWATDPLVARTTFRNWDLPQRRQILAGLRTARDDA
jgi:iron(II)-dependent oxidoreductase